MPEVVINLPDIGEGIAEAEVSEWHVEVGEWINEDDVIGTVLTDKAAVEIPSSVSGKVTWRAADAGETLAIGSPFVKIEASGVEDVGSAPEDQAPKAEAAPAAAVGEPEDPPTIETMPGTRPSARVLAAPAVRRRMADLGLDPSTIAGTGPEGRVTHADLDRRIAGGGGGGGVPSGDTVTETRVVGLRRKIAAQLSMAHANIPAITIVEELDVTELERLRAQMNAHRTTAQPKLTLLPFLVRAVVLARHAAPQVNARYDGDAGILSTHGAVHFGIATQTDRGLIVPVMRHAEARSVWGIAGEIARLALGARDGSLAREDLGGSTITITSLGPLGAIATTPIVNQPEVAIVGVNRKQIRPHWDGQAFLPREMMNISASFDHRIVDGHDAAVFIARFKALVETPALLFV